MFYAGVMLIVVIEYVIINNTVNSETLIVYRNNMQATYDNVNPNTTNYCPNF